MLGSSGPSTGVFHVAAFGNFSPQNIIQYFLPSSLLVLLIANSFYEHVLVSSHNLE